MSTFQYILYYYSTQFSYNPIKQFQYILCCYSTTRCFFASHFSEFQCILCYYSTTSGALCTHFQSKISIHHMLLFNTKNAVFYFFNNRISIHPMLLFNQSTGNEIVDIYIFQYTSCCYSTPETLVDKEIERAFQYILCYYSIDSCCRGTIISIHNMLLFNVKKTKNCLRTKNISIHPMHVTIQFVKFKSDIVNM